MITDYTLWNGDTVKVKIQGNIVGILCSYDPSKIDEFLELGEDYNGQEDTFYELEPIAETIDELINFAHGLDHDDKPE